MRKPILDMSRFMSSEATIRFVESRFDESIFLMKFMMNNSKFPQLRWPWDCPKLPQVHSVQQPLTQNQMREMCESIQQNVNQDYTYTVINFGEGYQVWNNQEFSLFETAIKMKIVGCKTEWNKLHEDDSRKVTIFIRGGEYKKSEAFLKYTEGDGTEQFFELEEFSLLSLVMPNLVDEEKSIVG